MDSARCLELGEAEKLRHPERLGYSTWKVVRLVGLYTPKVSVCAKHLGHRVGDRQFTVQRCPQVTVMFCQPYGLSVTFVSEPVPGHQHDMAKLAGSERETILKLASDAIDDKGFIGTDYIITPVRKPKDRDLHKSEHDYNNQISSLRAPVERAVANLKTWRIPWRDIPGLPASLARTPKR